MGREILFHFLTLLREGIVPLVLGLALSLSDNSVQNVRNIIPKGLEPQFCPILIGYTGRGEPNQCSLTNKNNFSILVPFFLGHFIVKR